MLTPPLLLGTDACHVHEFLCAVAAAGRAHGLELHEGKFQALQVRNSQRITNLSGQPVAASTSLGYLGATISADGSAGPELSRRIGIARGLFRTLCRVWRHSALTRRRKLEVFRALVETTLLYGLCSGCYTKADMRRLDGFQAKCLRVIMGIPSAYISRVSNEHVRQQASWTKASLLLLGHQLCYLGKILRSDITHPLRKMSFNGSTLQPANDAFIGRVGRPKKEWIKTILPDAIAAAEGTENLTSMTLDKLVWKKQVNKYLNLK